MDLTWAFRISKDSLKIRAESEYSKYRLPACDISSVCWKDPAHVEIILTGNCTGTIKGRQISLSASLY